MKKLSRFIKESVVAEKLASVEGQERFWFSEKQDDRLGRCRHLRESIVPQNGEKRRLFTLRGVFMQDNEFNKLWRLVVNTIPDDNDTRAMYVWSKENKRCKQIDEKEFEKAASDTFAAICTANNAKSELRNLLKSATLVASGRGGWKTLKNTDLPELSGTILFQAGQGLPFIVTSHADDFSTFTGISIDRDVHSESNFYESIFYNERERESDEVLEMSGWKIYTVDEAKVNSAYNTLKKAEAEFKSAMDTICSVQ